MSGRCGVYSDRAATVHTAPSKGEFIFGLPSGIDRNSDLWRSLSAEAKENIERNDDACRSRAELGQTPAGRLQLFLQEFRVGRMMMTSDRRIDPKRWKIEEACFKWWDEARRHREQQPAGTLGSLPPIPEGFDNSSRVQNALDALAEWAEDSLRRMALFQTANRLDAPPMRTRRTHDERDQQDILGAWQQASRAGVHKEKFLGDYSRQHDLDRKRVKRLLDAAQKQHRRKRGN